jgi:hypothetical protein
VTAESAAPLTRTDPGRRDVFTGGSSDASGWPSIARRISAASARTWSRTGTRSSSRSQELQPGANPVTDLTPLLDLGTLVNLGHDELTGVDQLRAAGISVNGLA